jgi:hypothetical protein
MRVVCLIAIAACAAAPKGTRRTKLATAVAAPHSFDIVAIAAPEEGDAALTKDRTGSLRIWPRLDGTREPIVVPIVDVAVDLALGHDGNGFIGAVIDEVGNVAVLDFDRNGGLLGRVQVGGDVAAIQLALLRNTILVLRNDSSIVQLDVHGNQLRRIVAPPRTRLEWIATRHGHAIAATPHSIFRLDVPRGLWVDTFNLAIEISGPIGLSPNGRRVTAIDASDEHAVLIELSQVPRVISHDKLYPATRERTNGFVDNAHAIVPSANERRWFDPPFVTTPKSYGVGFSEYALAIGDGIAISAESTASSSRHVAAAFGISAINSSQTTSQATSCPPTSSSESRPPATPHCSASMTTLAIAAS